MQTEDRDERGKGAFNDDASAGNDLERQVQTEVASIPVEASIDGTDISPTDANGPHTIPQPCRLLHRFLLLLSTICIFLTIPTASGEVWFVQLPNMFEVNVSGFCLGLVGGAVLIACNLALEKWGWASDKDAQAYTEKMVLQRYGRVRRVRYVIARLLLLGSIWNFCSEFIYRGLSPIFLAHTGAPTAVIVVLSSAAYGLEYGRLLQRVLIKRRTSGQVSTKLTYTRLAVLGTWMGAYLHALLLMTGNIFVPIVAHTVHDVFLVTLIHVKVTSPSYQAEAVAHNER